MFFESFGSDGELSPSSSSPIFWDDEAMDEFHTWDMDMDVSQSIVPSIGNYPYLTLQDGSITTLPPRRNGDSTSIYFDMNSTRPRNPPRFSYPTVRRRILGTITTGFASGFPIDRSIERPIENRPRSTYEERRAIERFNEIARLPIRLNLPTVLTTSSDRAFLSDIEILEAETRINGHHVLRSPQSYEQNLLTGEQNSFSGSISYSWTPQDEEALQTMIRDSRI